MLVGRSHKNTSDVLDELTILKASGAEVEIMTADMSDFDQVKA
ncbi:hypothetical protein HED51_22405 [Ochrobactrum grignonense]|nr:hypothetical protein [Brucella grignonensis]